jgi:hypothetical protein
MWEPKPNPERLWKYRSWDAKGHAKNLIVSGEIYYASKEQLNDPFEFRYHDEFPPSTDECDRFVKALCAKVYPRDSREQWRDHYTRLKREVEAAISQGGRIGPTSANITLGVFSASEVNADILMWSHYADHHHGICVGVLPDVINRLFLPVQYLDDIPVHNVWDYVYQTDVDFMRYSLFKSPRWAHEREWRTMHPVGPERFPGCVDQIILGAQIKSDVRSAVLEAAAQSSRAIDVFQAKLGRRKYALDISPLN